MFRTKKDVDKQVRSMLSKIREDEKPLRGYKIALMYFKIGEYDSAVEYLKRYIMVDDKHPAAHKMLGQCYEKLKRPDKQLEAYQRSLELDKKQTDLLVEVCKLMQNNELSDVTPAKARYWYEMAESRNIHDTAVLNLKLKFSQPGDNVAIQDIIFKEIVRRPFDSGLRIRLVQHFLDQKRIDDAFNYVHDLEIKSIPKFRNSNEWYTTVTQVLDKYKEKYSASIHKNWPYWLMLITVLERQIFLALLRTPKDFNSINQNFTTASALLFEFDQNLNRAATSCSFPDAERNLASEFLAHFRGQLCLHAASLLFKRESDQSTRDTSLQTTKLSLPLLLLAFNCGSVNKNQQWLKAVTETTVQLVDVWHSQSNFRLSQAGRILQSCISASTTADNAVLANLRKIGLDNKYGLWSNKDDLLNEIRSTVADTEWRKKIYRVLFKNKEHLDAASGSHFLKSRALETPTFDWPVSDALSTLEENAQSAEPSSLPHMVYLTLCRNNTWKDKTITINPESRCILFGKLSFSIQNLLNCSAESLNQLDIDSFVYAATIQAKRKLTVENSILNATTPNDSHKPKMLPFANMASDLATEDQSDWFEAAYKVYNNASGDDLAAIRATLQHGIEAVRGVGNPKMDLIILLKLGQLFSKRAQNSTKSIERSFFEDRSEALFKFSLQMLRMQNSSRSNEPYRRLFKFATGSSYFEIDSEVNSLAEEAITFLAGRYFRNNAFEECAEDFAGIKLPFATYFQAESYRKMTEFSNTPKKNKRTFLDKARDCLKQTVDLLDGPNVDKNHPLKSIIDGDIERLQNETRKLETNQTMTDSFVSANGRSDLDDSNDRIDRETEVVTPVPQANYDNLERLIRQVIESLAILKDDVNEKMIEINERLQDIEDNLSKEQDDIPSADEEDYYYGNDETRPNVNNTSMMVNVSRSTTRTPKQRQGSSNQQLSRSQMVPQSHPSPMVGMNNSFNPLYPGFYGQMPFNPYQAGNMASMSPVLPYNEVMNYNLQQQMLAQQLAADSRNASFLGLLHSSAPLQQSPQVHPTVPAQVALPLSVNSPLAATSNLAQFQQPSTNLTALPSTTVETPSKGITTTPVIPAGQKPWNASMNNQPVEKGPPVNVVITNSDRLPSSNITTPSTVSFSVTIPPQHIKINPAVPMAGAAVKNPSIVAALQDKKMPQSNPTLNSTTQSTTTVPTSQEQKSIFGHLSKPFSSTPFGSPSSSLSSTISSTAKPSEKSQIEATKSPFSEFSFAQPTTKMESPFAKLNPIDARLPIGSAKPNDATVSTSVVDTSREEEADNYEPTAHFEPVIPLPDLVEVKTGEENEAILFEHRAKLLRYVKESKEWKERGIGTMKVMVNKDDPNKVRLLMRRDQVYKLCCNQMLTKDTKFNKMPNTETALSWFGQDYSENELQVEMLAIRFKTAEVCKQFHAAVMSAQEKMTDGATASKSLNKEPLLSNPIMTDVKGFGDQFKPKAGSWNCEACYISNKETDKVCVACATSKDKNAPAAEQSKAAAFAPTFSFGNSGTGFAQKSTTTTSTSSVFGNLSLTTTNANKPSPVVPATNTPTKGFGDQFKPKPGSWSCKACYTSNTGENLYCLACEEPKDDTVPKKGSQNAFGSSNVSAAPSKSTFSFGNLSGCTTSPQTTISANSSAFGSSTFNFSLGSQSLTQPKPANESNVPHLDSKEFSFVFKSKSPAKVETNVSTGLEDVSDDENVEEEENNTYFTPVIPLPDKIEVKSGEEDEDVLYTHRAKLYRFRDKEWRERGLGDIKILRHKQTGRLRVVMRREQIQKICLNHVLVSDIEYKIKDSKSWSFVVSDFSEGVLETDNFCIRFKTDEIALDFKKAIDGALDGSLEPIQQNGDVADANSEAESPNAEERQTLTDLKLPKDFFNYKKQEQCTGCRGCKSDDFAFSEVKDTNFGQSDDNPLSFAAPPPQKTAKDLLKSNQTSLFSMQSNATNVATPTGSIFGGNSFKTISAFGSGDASKSTFSFGQTNNSYGTEAKPSIFGQTKTTTAPQFGSASIFGGNTNGTGLNSSSGFSFKLGSAATENNNSPATPASETKATSTPIFGEKAMLSFGDLAAKVTPPNNNSTNNTSSNFSFASLSKAAQDPTTDSPLFSGGGNSFANLAKSAETVQSVSNSFSFSNTPAAGGFFGLSNKHTFNNLMQPSSNGSANNSNQNVETAGNDENSAEDPNYDPHYEPIIALPDEIQVSTGEEEEQKLFGERAKLFRYDATNKEWKERGVGEIKILYHPVNQTYRLLLRREQIHKLVLNMAITSEFQMNPMKQSDKAFCWVAQNYAEDQQNGELESLSVRFKNANLADKFNTAVKNGIAQLKARGDLEPQDD